MAYYLAVWDGPEPSNDEAAMADYKRLYEYWMSDDAPLNDAPTAALAAYIDALLARWPDITTDAGEDSPWSDGPLVDNALGPFFYFGVSWPYIDSVPAIAQMAKEHGLVCFDLGTEQMR